MHEVDAQNSGKVIDGESGKSYNECVEEKKLSLPQQDLHQIQKEKEIEL
jgi:hypothetical protein